MSFDQTWLPFIYLYGVGGVAFGIGMFLIFKTNALRSNYNKHKTWIWILFYGYFFYASMHALFIFLAMGSK